MNLSHAFLLLLACCFKTYSYIKKETYQSQTDQGEFSSVITAVPEQLTDPAQHFLCGYAMREMKWRKMMYNCNCSNRMDTLGVVSIKCDWCENTFWSMRNGFKAIFCSINDWSSQITKIFETGNIQSRNWKEYKCPKGFYVKHAAGRLGTQQETILGFTGMKMVCSKLEQNQTVSVEDPSKHCLDEQSDNSPGTFVSAVQIKSEKAGKITGLKWIFEGIAYIKQASVEYGSIAGTSTSRTIEIVPLSKGENSETTKIKVPLTTPLTISYLWQHKNPYFSMYKVADLYLKPPTYQMEKDEGIYMATRSKYTAYTPSTTTYTPISPVYATILPSSNVTAYTKFQEFKTNVAYKMTVQFYDKTTEEFIVEKIIEGVYVGIVEGPISIVFEQKQCVGAWMTTNYVFNGDFEQNSCSTGCCVWNQVSIRSNLPGWIPSPQVQIGRGNLYNPILGNSWVCQLDVSFNSCIKQKISLGPGRYSLSFDRTARVQFSLESNQMEVKLNGSVIKKIFPENYFVQRDTIEMTLNQPSNDYWLQFCGAGKSEAYGIVIDNIKLLLYNDCETVDNSKY